MTKKARTAGEELPLDMSRLNLRVGKMTYIQEHPVAPDTVYFPIIDVAEEFSLTIATGLAKHYSMEQLEDRMVVVLTNLKPIDVYGTSSDGLVLCASTPQKVEILSPPAGAVPGDVVTVQGCSPPAGELPRIKNSLFNTIAADLWVDSDKRAVYKGAPLQVEGKGFVTAETLLDCPIRCPVKY